MFQRRLRRRPRGLRYRSAVPTASAVRRVLFPLSWFLAPLLAQAPLPDAAAADAGEECTIGVAAGSATADGRPMVWKNRDSKQRDDAIEAFADGAVPYVALCDHQNRTIVWGGANAAGFCILNAVSRDLPQGSKTGPGNGGFQRLALQRCASLADFERLLAETDRSGRRTRGNFGVIDAHGGAAMFEVGHATWKRFDAATSPGGVIVRTNFSATGGGAAGRERFARARNLVDGLPKGRRVDLPFLLEDFLRDIAPPPTAAAGPVGTLDARETIFRQTTVAALVCQGCKDGEEPRATTLWALLGPARFTIAVPCFPATGAVAAELGGGGRPSELCAQARRLADGFWAPESAPGRDEHAEAASGGDHEGAETEAPGPLRRLRTPDLPKLAGDLLPVERSIRSTALQRLAAFRAAKPTGDVAVLRAAHDAAAADALRELRALADRYAPVPAGR